MHGPTQELRKGEREEREKRKRERERERERETIGGSTTASHNAKATEQHLCDDLDMTAAAAPATSPMPTLPVMAMSGDASSQRAHDTIAPRSRGCSLTTNFNVGSVTQYDSSVAWSASLTAMPQSDLRRHALATRESRHMHRNSRRRRLRHFRNDGVCKPGHVRSNFNQHRLRRLQEGEAWRAQTTVGAAA